MSVLCCTFALVIVQGSGICSVHIRVRREVVVLLFISMKSFPYICNVNQKEIVLTD